MFELKPLSEGLVPEALEKAERYRLLNEPLEAESICLDVLSVQPGNQRALVSLLLALTDQFSLGIPRAAERAKDLLPKLDSEYGRAYYAGIIAERRGKSRMLRGGHGSGHVSYDLFREAMEWYEKAEALRPEGNDDAILRWNTCARIIMSHPEVRPEPAGAAEPALE